MFAAMFCGAVKCLLAMKLHHSVAQPEGTLSLQLYLSIPVISRAVQVKSTPSSMEGDRF